MLRYKRRWHDAANGPLNGEARLLCFTRVPTGVGSTPPPDDENENENAETTPEAPQSDAANTQREPAENVSTEQKLKRRQAEQVLLGAIAPGETETPKAAEVLGHAKGLRQRLMSYDADAQLIDQTLKKLEDEGVAVSPTDLVELDWDKKIVKTLAKRTEDFVFPLEELKLEEWERGDMPPSTFLELLKKYKDNLNTIDASDVRLTPEMHEERRKTLEYFYEEAEKAVRECRTHVPSGFAAERIHELKGLNDDQIWALYNKRERDDIIGKVSKAAGTNVLKLAIARDIAAVEEVLDPQELKKGEKTLKERLLETQRDLLEKMPDKYAEAAAKAAATAGHDDESHDLQDILGTIRSTVQRVNKTAGIEWMTVNELLAAFTEVYESIKEVKKRESAGRIARAALMIGRVASYVPGLGGDDLVNVLDELLDHKNNEIKDAYKKELGNPREDLGFTDLFIGGHNGISRMQYYMNLGDTNRTRAILEFAAGKALLYGIEDKDADTFVVPPGRYTLRQVLPPEWSDHQVAAYVQNLQFQNNQGQAAQIKAGEELVKGRDSLKGFLDPFKGSVNGMSLWFSKGIAEAALKKVKKGEMSASLTLIVLDAWEHNPLFRKYVPTEWLARFSGDSKQMLVGMLKYDQVHLINSAQGDYITNDLSKMRAAENEPWWGPARLGPLVAAVRKYVLKKDPSLKDDPKEFTSVVAQVLASQTVKREVDGKLTYMTLYSPELMPYHIKYKPNEMRGANVEALGDDNFIERSEIINGTVEVMKAVGQVSQDGFRSPEKARYFFSHIIDNYQELLDYARDVRKKGRGAEALELEQAAEKFREKRNKELDLWIEDALSVGGAKKLLKIQHKNQDGRYLVLTLLQKGLISLDKIKELAPSRNGAQELLDQYNRAEKVSRPSDQQGSQPGANPAGTTAA